MKDIIGKLQIKSTNLSRKLTDNKVNVYNKPKKTDAFNDFFTNIAQELASQIPKSSQTFKAYINKVDVIMGAKSLSIKKLKDTFFSLKLIKSSSLTKLISILLKISFRSFVNS